MAHVSLACNSRMMYRSPAVHVKVCIHDATEKATCTLINPNGPREVVLKILVVFMVWQPRAAALETLAQHMHHLS